MTKQLCTLLSVLLVAVFVYADDQTADVVLPDGARCGIGSMCNGHGKCKKTVTEYGETGFCECNEGYSGEFCGTNCGSNDKCSGHGQCILSALGTSITFYCQCEEGYTGKYCSVHCGNPPNCNGHGECEFNVWGPNIFGKCKCNKGYTGPLCDKISVCESSRDVCKPNYDCKDLDNGYECTCDTDISPEGECEHKTVSRGMSETKGSMEERSGALQQALTRYLRKRRQH